MSTVVATFLRTLSPRTPGNLGAALTDGLGSETSIALVPAAAIAAWYALWRRAEPSIRLTPDGLALTRT